MNRPSTLLLLFFLALTSRGAAEPPANPQLEAATKKFEQHLELAKREYRKALAEALAGKLRIEVYLLDFEMTDFSGGEEYEEWRAGTSAEHFAIVPYSKTAKILKSKVLSPDETALLLPSLRTTLSVEENTGGAMCHLPIHGIRIWDGGHTLIFQTSLCYECSNFFVLYPSGQAEWTGLTSRDFDQTMQTLLPIPKAERDRFDMKVRGKKTK